MRKILKVARFVFLLLIALFVVAIGSLLALRIYRQHLAAQALAIHSPNGIDEGMYVRIGGIDVAWLPQIDSLQADARDPLDP